MLLATVPLLPPRPSLWPTLLLLLPSSRNPSMYTARNSTPLLVVNRTRMMRLARPWARIALNCRLRRVATPKRTVAMPSMRKAARPLPLLVCLSVCLFVPACLVKSQFLHLSIPLRPPFPLQSPSRSASAYIIPHLTTSHPTFHPASWTTPFQLSHRCER